jgi:hypothetical protein
MITHVYWGTGELAQLAQRYYRANAVMNIATRNRPKPETPADVDRDIDIFLSDTSPRTIVDLASLATDDLGTVGGMMAQIIRLEARIGGRDPSTLVQLAARRVLMSWTELHISESSYYRMIKEKGVISPGIAQWRASAGRRLNSAIKTLAFIRRCEQRDIEQALRTLRIA